MTKLEVLGVGGGNASNQSFQNNGISFFDSRKYHQKIVDPVNLVPVLMFSVKKCEQIFLLNQLIDKENTMSSLKCKIVLEENSHQPLRRDSGTKKPWASVVRKMVLDKNFALLILLSFVKYTQVCKTEIYRVISGKMESAYFERLFLYARTHN